MSSDKDYSARHSAKGTAKTPASYFGKHTRTPAHAMHDLAQRNIAARRDRQQNDN